MIIEDCVVWLDELGIGGDANVRFGASPFTKHCQKPILYPSFPAIGGWHEEGLVYNCAVLEPNTLLKQSEQEK